MRKILFFVLLSCFVFGQNKKIDSLRNELKKRKIDKFLDYKELTIIFIDIANIDSTKKYAKITMDYAIKKKNNSYLASATILDSWNYLFKLDYKNAHKRLDDAVILARKAKDEKIEVFGNFGKINIFYINQDYKNVITNGNKILDIADRIKIKDNDLLETLSAIHLYKSVSYSELGLFDEAKKEIIAIKKISDINFIENIYTAEYLLYQKMKNQKKVIEVCLKLIKYIKNINSNHKEVILRQTYLNLAITYSLINEVKKSEYYLLLAMNEPKEKHYHVNLKILKPYVFETKSRNSISIELYNDAIKFADSAIYYANLNKDTKVIAGALNQKAKAYCKMKNYDKAVENNEEALKLFKKLNYTNEVQSILEELVKIYNVNGNKQKLTTVFEEYLKIKDKVFNEQVAKSITTAEIKYQTELKEAQIKSQQLELEKEKTNRNIAISGIGFLLLLSGGGFWFFKNSQKQKELQNQNTLLGLQQNLNAMELQSLNKQLDPHEIKNLLASISPEIQEKAPESYRKMLKLFNITKASLNNHSLTESIENQIQQTEDFLSLEKSMLPEPLEYSIENKIQQKDQQIPRLMLKNLVENAVKHGIKGKENGGTIKIELFEKNNFIYITVDDTGRGRKQTISSDSGIGTSTYQKLFATLNHKNKDNATFEITDKEQGTKVEVRIPKDYKYN